MYICIYDGVYIETTILESNSTLPCKVGCVQALWIKFYDYVTNIIVAIFFFLCWGKNSGLWACLVLSYQNISLAFQNRGVCVHACRCVEIKGNQHAISQKATTLFLDSGSHWPGNSSSSLDWLASESPEFPLFYLLSAGSVRGHHHIQPLPAPF